MDLKKDFPHEGKLTERYLNTTNNKILCSDNCKKFFNFVKLT